MELTVGSGTVENQWHCVRVKGQTNNADVIVRSLLDLPTRTMMLMNLFFEELRYTSNALVLMEGFNLPEINWKHHTAGTTCAGRMLKNLDDSLMEEILRELTGKDSLFDLLLVDKVDLMSKVEIGGCLGHTDHEVIKFKISVERKKSANKTLALDMRRADFRLLREFVS